MSKNLKNEYLNRIDLEEIPDLWGRISAQLPEKNTVSQMEKPSSIMEPVNFKRRNIYRWSTIAAASVCLLAAVPVLLRASRQATIGKSVQEDLQMKEMVSVDEMAMDAAKDQEELLYNAEVLFASDAAELSEEAEMSEEMISWVTIDILSVYRNEDGILCLNAEINSSEENGILAAKKQIIIWDEEGIGEALSPGEAEVALEPVENNIFILKNFK